MAKKATKRTKKIAGTTTKKLKMVEATQEDKAPPLVATKIKPKIIKGSPTVTIDCEFADLLSPLTADEYRALEESLCKDGLRDPLIVWEDEDGEFTLVDGYNRFEICLKHKIAYHICVKTFASRDDVKLWIWDNQEGHRNMSPFRRVEVTLNLKDIIAAEAKGNQRKGGGSGSSKLNKLTIEKVHTYKILAKRAGVPENTYRNAESIVKKIEAGKVDVKDIDALRSGKKKINSIYKKYCNSKPALRRPPQDLAGRIDTTLSNLEKQFAHVDRTDFYDMIIKWANAQKKG